MRIESNLCHVSEHRVVVQVIGWINKEKVGSALAEGMTVEAAEDKAISRLKDRLKIVYPDENNKKNNINSITKSKSELNIDFPIRNMPDNLTINNNPSDWSNELTAIDLEINRLDWSRDDEIDFLEKNFGYNNRSKITKYTELVKYLKILRSLEKSSTSQLNNLNLNSMIEESNTLLHELSWDIKQGREYLQKEFNVSTRKELTENQLLVFIEKLKSIRNQYSEQ